MSANGGPLGKAIANMVAEALRQTLISVLPAVHAERWKHANDAAKHVAGGVHTVVSGIAEVADMPELHPALRPLFDILKKGGE